MKARLGIRQRSRIRRYITLLSHIYDEEFILSKKPYELEELVYSLIFEDTPKSLEIYGKYLRKLGSEDENDDNANN